MKPSITRKNAFTLLELSIVLVIIGVIMGGVIAMLNSTVEDASYRATQAKLDTLRQSLIDYRIVNNRLPCPADSTLLYTVANFGVEAAAAGNCGGGAPAADISSATAAIGMVPVRTLGLPDDMAFDGWGRRISYAVSPDYITANAFDGIAATDTTVRLTVGHITAATTAPFLTTTGAFVLISAGKNGHGALSRETAAPIDVDSANLSELLNCKCDDDAVYDVGVDVDNFVLGNPTADTTSITNNFDDVVVFGSRIQLRDGDE